MGQRRPTRQQNNISKQEPQQTRSENMPPRMSFGSPGGSGSIENGNRLGARPVVRQSKFYREGNSGNAVKDLLGQGDLAWDLNQQEGAFAGHPMYDGRQQGYIHGQQQQRPPQRPPQAPPPQQWQQQQQQLLQAQQQASQQRQRPRGVSFPEGMPAPSRGGPFQLPPYSGQAGTNAAHVFGGGPPPTGPPEEAEYPLPGSVASCDACGEVVNRYYHCQDCREETGLFDLCVKCCGQIYLQGGQRIAHPTHNYGAHVMQHVVPVR